MDEFSASDGDIFPYRFSENALGKLIGKRSWGGVVGIRETLPIVDGGFLNKPEFAPFSKDGKEWPVEGHGVEPDIVVDNDPAKEFSGTDQQLDRGIEEILSELKTNAKPIPPAPPFPTAAEGRPNPHCHSRRADYEKGISSGEQLRLSRFAECPGEGINQRRHRRR